MMTIDSSRYSSIIFDILASQQGKLSSEDKRTVVSQLQERAWVQLRQGLFMPSQVLEIKPASLRKHLSKIVEISNGRYIDAFDLKENERELLSYYELLTKFGSHDVIKHILKGGNPHLNAVIVCDALKELKNSKGNQKIDEETFKLLKTTAWVPCQELVFSGELNQTPTNGIAVSPADIIDFSDIADLEKILSQSRSNRYVAISQVVSEISREDSFKWLKDWKDFFIQGDKALDIIGQCVNKLQVYWIGNIASYDFKVIWDILNNTPSSASLGWGLANNLSQAKFNSFIFKNTCQTPVDPAWIILLLNHIANSNPEPDAKAIIVYNYLLEIACKYSDFAQVVLPKIKLLNQSNEWREPNNLCWEEDLEGVVISASILSQEQRGILLGYLDSLVKPSRIADLDRDIDYIRGSNFEILRGYFQHWERGTRSQFIGAFLSLLTKNEPNLEKLAEGYLNRDISLFRSRLLNKSDAKEVALKSVRILLNQSQNESREVFSVTGKWFSVTTSSGCLSNFVENINAKLNPAEIGLTLFDISEIDSPLEDLLKKATKKIISTLYNVAVSAKEFDAIWNELRSRQLDIQVARNYVLKEAPHILRVLGLDKTSKLLNEILQRWDKKRHDQAELEAQNLPWEKSIRKEAVINLEIKKIIREISALFEDETPECSSFKAASLSSIRQKMEDFGYKAASIPFEIFQNADDAVVEMEKILPGSSLNETRQKLIIDWNDKHITFMHWGRPINLCWISNNLGETYKKEGFDRDLEKMVVLNISDKSAGTTGKFGLGFKSVHLFTNSCQVVSSDLAFTVVGGLLPAKLTVDVLKENDKNTIVSQSSLREKLRHFSELTDGTLIHLNADPDLQTSAKEIIENFRKFIPLLLIFSRRIRQFSTIGYGGRPENCSWKPRQVLNLAGIEAGEVELESSFSATDVNRHRLLCLRPQCLTGELESAALLLGFISRNSIPESSLSKDVPTFWVTAPTQEKLGLSFIVNANFDVTTGRESLVKGSSHNRELAKRFGEKLGVLLTELFYKSDQNWEDFTSDLGVTSLNQYDFWHFVWNELVTKWQKLNDSSSAENMFEILRLIFSGKGGMGYLMTHSPALPTGLWGNYQKLIELNQVEYVVEGVLATEPCFRPVAQWPKFVAKYKDSLLLNNVRSDLEDLLERKVKLKSLQLVDVLRLEISGPSQDVDCEQSQRLGRLVIKQFLEDISDANELNQIQGFLDKTSFKAKDGKFYLSKSLLLPKGDAQEERLLAGFAPKSRLLHPEYSGNALSFFMACRNKRDKVDLDTLVSWVLEAEESQHRAVLNYLLEGNDRDELAGKLVDKEGWFLDEPEFRRLIQHAEDRAVIKAGEFEEPEASTSFPEIEEGGNFKGIQDPGTGYTGWGPPGEFLARRFYGEKLGCEIFELETDAVDFECLKGDEDFEVEVKTISSKAIRLPIYEWDRLISKGESYELLIVHHNGQGNVDKIIRVKNAWASMTEALEKLKCLSLTTAQEDTNPNVESLLGLQQDKDRDGKPINVIILNWVKLVDEHAHENSLSSAIEIYHCSAQLVSGQDSVIDLQWL